MKRTLILPLLVLWAFPGLCAWRTMPETGHRIASPDGKFEFAFCQEQAENGWRRMVYTVSYDGRTVVEQSELGVLIDNKLFESALGIPNDTLSLWGANLELTGVENTSHDEIWRPVYGERSTVRDRYNQMTLRFRKGTGNDGTIEDGYDKRAYYLMNLIVRAYDEGIAFRYSFPEAANGLFLRIAGEQTRFTMPDGTMAWYERWAQGPYSLRPLSGWTDECERPLTMHLPCGLIVSIAEAEMVDYARMKFKLRADNELQTSLYGGVSVVTPYETPWRVVMAAETPARLLENNDIMLNLNPACRIADTSWIRPGKAFRVMRLTQSDALSAVDFAAERGLQYIHLDAKWYGPEMETASDAASPANDKDLDIPAIVEYAAAKGIGVWLYVNQRALAAQLDRLLPLYREWGIKGIKFGFVQVGDQMWTSWLHEAVRKCAEYELMVDIHDEYRPTGFSRTFPNLLTQEGIRGNEEMPDAQHNTILPFTRYIAGAADYTICWYSDRIRTTRAHQLAMSVICYSPLQFIYWYDTPGDFAGDPETDFFARVPTVWDDTKILGGHPGEYVSTARRSGDEWFVGIITNNDPREVRLDFGFLKPGMSYHTSFYGDDGIVQRVVDHTTVVDLQLKASGGCAVHLVPKQPRK